MQTLIAPLILALSLAAGPAAPGGPLPAGEREFARADYAADRDYLTVETQHPAIYELRQGGKVALSGVIPGTTGEIDLAGGVKAGEFELTLYALAWRKAETAGKQGTGLGDLLDPKGVAFDNTGRVVVADSGNDRVQVFTPTLVPAFEFGGFNWQERDVSTNRLSDSSRGSFNGPADAACTIRNLYVTDRENHRVQKFDLDGNFLLAFGGSGNGRGRMTFPTGIAADKMGNLYVVDTRNDRIQKFDTNGNFVLEIGGFGYAESRFNAPRDVAVDGAERICVLDGGNRRVQVFDRYGHYQNEFKTPDKGDFDSIATVLNEAVVLTDARDGTLAVLTRTGEPLDTIGGLRTPRGIAADADGNLAVIEAGRAAVTRYERTPDRAKWKFRK